MDKEWKKVIEQLREKFELMTLQQLNEVRGLSREIHNRIWYKWRKEEIEKKLEELPEIR